jgi:hypothetical protein
MDANDLPSAAVHLAERRDKRGMLLSRWLVARCEDAVCTENLSAGVAVVKSAQDGA